ncbi:MAG: CotH kinase family protein, partial [Deltaproteobacteria bacterium]|nr:CotH kinase family protein [Deltaproteobacteria bacterium]
MAKPPRGPDPASHSDNRDGSRRRRGDAAWLRLARRLAVLSLTVCLVGACASDPSQPQEDGAAGPTATMCGVPDVALQTASAAELFNATKVPTFDLYLPEADWEALQSNARDEEYVAAQGCYEGRALGTVGLRFKGSYGSLYDCFDAQGNMICPRLSLKIKFDEYVTDQRFFGRKRLNFNAYMHDDSRMKEKLAYDLFRAMGIVTPRSAWAVLRVNGGSLGLFGMVEQVDGRFTADRWPDNPDGNLYKELWPTHAPDEQILAALETNEETADIGAYRAFAQAFMAADEPSWLSTLGSYMDLDYLARFLAVEDALASYDGVTYFWTDGVT